VDPYVRSVAAHKLRLQVAHGRPLHLACLDIDSTLTGDSSLAGAVRSRLEDEGYVIAFDTSRTEEMVMSRESYERSVRAGALSRPEPHLGHDGGSRVFVAPEQDQPRGILDGDIIAGSTGTHILVRQPDGAYLPDRVCLDLAGFEGMDIFSHDYP